MTIRAYRISKAQYAGAMWSGTGLRDFGARWNSRGLAVVYTAESRSLAAMEQLVHLVKPRILRGYVIAAVEFDDARVQRLSAATLPARWNNPVAPPALRSYGDQWLTSAAYPVLAVPSAIIPGEWNYLINTGHAEFGPMPKSAPEPFGYDPRLA